MSKPLTIAAIVAGCQRGQRHYQRELVDRFSPQLLTIARRYVPDHGYAQDVLQDSLVKILTRIDQYTGKGSFEGWMARLVVNTALHRLDRSWVRRELPSEFLEEDHRTVEPYVIEHLATQDILDCVARLPEGYRHVFNLYAIEGYSHKEVAELLDMREVTCRSYYARARKLLRGILSHQKIGIRYAE